MIYGSVCSGIEAASVAWEPLGWKAAWFSEIEKFPSAVLASHWPSVKNLGDMTRIATAVKTGVVEAPDILVGGTPCQAFSVAGLRNGLSDERGKLTLSYVELADAIDDKRRERGEEEAIIVWENVPGVLNTKDNAFGCFIGALAGEDSHLQPSGKKWTNSGCVYGPSRIVAWRVLDAQFFGVAQRRCRVFVIASARKKFDPTEVLFEFESLRRDTPPSRCETTKATVITGKRAQRGSHWDNSINPHPTLNQSHNTGGIGYSNQEIFSQRGSGLIGIASSDKRCPAIAISGNTIGRAPANGGNGTGFHEELSYTLTKTDLHGVMFNMKVRRLTPVEYERLQGLPDNHTRIGWRGNKVEDCPDGHRYKAIGNSMPVPVMRWIGERIMKCLPK